jgi:hypothetical protein
MNVTVKGQHQMDIGIVFNGIGGVSRYAYNGLPWIQA